MKQQHNAEGKQRVTMPRTRKWLDELIDEAFDEENPVLIEALPATGKSYGIAKWASETGNPVTVFTERHELYDAYEKWATEEHDLTVQQLPVFHNECPTVKKLNDNNLSDNGSVQTGYNRPGGYSEELRDEVLLRYNQGIFGRELHNRASAYFDQSLPCEKDTECPYMEALSRDTEDIDILIGNFRQAFAEDYQEDRYVVFDEFPSESFIQEFSSKRASSTVSRYVSSKSELPFESWKGVSDYDHEREQKGVVSEWLENRSHDRDTKPIYKGRSGKVDARGPLLTEIALRFTSLDNHWRRADLGDGRVAVRSPNNQEISLLDPPPISEANGVVAVDGTPCIEKWELLLGESLESKSLFTDEQKRAFLQGVLEIQFIQTSDDTKPYLSGNSVTLDEDMALIEEIVRSENRELSLISSKAAIDEYKERGVSELVDKTDYYNNLKGSNRFAQDRLGMVIGCPQPGDNHIELWGALAGHSIVRKEYENGEKTKGTDLDFGPFGNLILQDSRENEVLQAAMRFGREESSEGRKTTVYLHTAAVPGWLDAEEQTPNIHSWMKGGGVTTVINTIKSIENWREEEWKTNKIADNTADLGRQRVREILRDTLMSDGYISSRRGGRGNAHIWSNESLGETGEYGIVEW